MDLTELSPVADADLPVEAFRAHLRLGAGFVNDAAQDVELIHYLRAALAVVENRCGKALLARDFRLVVRRWRWPDSQVLPLAPVIAITDFVLRDRHGAESPVDPTRWRLAADRHRPRLVALSPVLPVIAHNGQAEITFSAGFGAAWADMPDDLAQAVLLLAAQYFEQRTGLGEGLPASVSALLARWVPMRLSLGGRRQGGGA
ncbi:MAG: hypothetical protein ACK4LQ_01800 [Pararhodobacter sp.]